MIVAHELAELRRVPPRKRVVIGRQLYEGHLRIIIVMDHVGFWADIPEVAVKQYGLRKACRLARDILREKALQRRLKLLEAPGPSRLIH